MRRSGKRTPGPARPQRIGVSAYRRAGVQIGTTNGRECVSFNSRPSVSSRGYLEVLHVIGGSKIYENRRNLAVFISEFRFGQTERVLHSFDSGGDSSSAKGYVPPVTVYPSALKSAAKSFSICAAASNGIGLRYS